MDVETLITRRYDDIDIIKSTIPMVLQDLYPGRNTNIDITEVERLFVENAKNAVMNPIIEEESEDEEDDVDNQIEIYTGLDAEEEIHYHNEVKPVESQVSIYDGRPHNVYNDKPHNDDRSEMYNDRSQIDEHHKPEMQYIANKIDFITASGGHVKIERTEASYIPTTTTMPTPAYRQEYDKDKHICDLNEKIKQLESEKTSNAKRFLMMLKGEKEHDKRRRRVRIYASEHGFNLTEEDLDSFSQKEFDYIYTSVMKARNKNVYLLVYYTLFINGLRIANKVIKQKKLGIDLQYVIDSITSDVFIEEMEDAMPEILTSTITSVTQTHNPLLKLLYLIVVKPVEIKLPAMLIGSK